MSKILLLTALVIVLVPIGTFPIMWLINTTFTPHVLTEMFGVGEITFWETFRLILICSILFKSYNSSFK